MNKRFGIMLVPLILAFTTYLLTIGSVIDDRYIENSNINETDDTVETDEDNQEVDGDTLDETLEVEIQHLEIERKDGYNSILLNFHEYINDSTVSALGMEIDLYCIYSPYDGYWSLAEAEEAGAIQQFKANGDHSYSFLLKSGYKFNAKLTPVNKNIDGMDDSKANIPIEFEAIENCNKQLNVFDITFNYKSRLLDVSVEPTTYS